MIKEIPGRGLTSPVRPNAGGLAGLNPSRGTQGAGVSSGLGSPHLLTSCDLRQVTQFSRLSSGGSKAHPHPQVRMSQMMPDERLAQDHRPQGPPGESAPSHPLFSGRTPRPQGHLPPPQLSAAVPASPPGPMWPGLPQPLRSEGPPGPAVGPLGNADPWGLRPDVRKFRLPEFWQIVQWFGC